jgi:hypothetical protein
VCSLSLSHSLFFSPPSLKLRRALYPERTKVATKLSELFPFNTDSLS